MSVSQAPVLAAWLFRAGSAGNDAGATAHSVTKTPVEGQEEGFGWVRCSISYFCFKRKTRSAQFLDNQLAQWFARWLVIEGLTKRYLSDGV